MYWASKDIKLDKMKNRGRSKGPPYKFEPDPNLYYCKFIPEP